MTLANLQIDQDRLVGELEKLATFSDAPEPAVTRILFSPTELAARAYIRQLMREAGLTVREDGVGNIFGRWTGAQPDLPPVATGSHIDAIPFSGRFDGTVGVLGGVEAVRALKQVGFQPERSIELIMFTSEEPTRFGLGCLGSRALTGSLTPDQLAKLHDNKGRSFVEVRNSAGYQQNLDEVAIKPGTYDAFIELHIEQGPQLEQANLPIGLVTSIAAPATMRVTLDGEGGHAGAVLMPGRRDALAAASALVLAVEQAAFSTGRRDSVATVGLMQIHPGAVNSIPSHVVMEIDIRDTAQAPRDSMVAFIQAALEKIAAKRQIQYAVEMLNADPPSQSGAELLKMTRKACDKLHLEYMELVSRAYHDTLFMSKICPTAMIFIPCKNGYSHRPEEYASPLQIQRGVRLLAQTLADVSGNYPANQN